MSRARTTHRERKLADWIVMCALLLAAIALGRAIGNRLHRAVTRAPLRATISIGDTLWQQYAVERVDAAPSDTLIEAIAAPDPITHQVGASFVAIHCGTFTYHARIVTQSGRLLQAVEQRPIIVTIEGCQR